MKYYEGVKLVSKNWKEICNKLNIEYIPTYHAAYSDKGESFSKRLNREYGIPVYKGVILYFISYHRPYSKQVRQTEKGWVDVYEWMKQNQHFCDLFNF